MAKKIKHPYILDATYQVYENSEFEELENVIAKVYEYTEKAEDEQLDLDKRKDYLEIRMKRIIPSRDCDDVADIADSDSSELLNAILPIIKPDHDEFISNALKIDSQILLDKFIYIDTITINGDFSELSISAALSKVLKMVTKGAEPEDWVAGIYEDRTIFNGEEPLERKKSTAILKDLGFFALPTVVSGFEKKDNVVSIAGGNTLTTKLEYEPELLEKKIKKVKP
jgi:hypothetical protein